ncbi:MAG: hypothetical protein HQL99_13200 [Magnetococcales bacterium]|nr:hypothetical protein [Magnetococcales bacterium]
MSTAPVARRGRPPAQSVEVIPEIPTPNLSALAEAVNEVAGAEAMIMNSYEVIKQIGRIEAFEFQRKVADVALAQTFEQVKNSKKYKGLPYIDRDGKTRHVADLEEFCEVFLGRSARRIQELVQNLSLLGSELYERAEVIGFKSRDYAALKALPAADQEVIKTAMQAEDRDQVIGLLQEMAARHQREKETLKKQKDESDAAIRAKDEMLSKRLQKIDTLEAEIAKRNSITQDAKEQERQRTEMELIRRLQNSTGALLARIQQFAQDLANMEELVESESGRVAVANTVHWVFRNIHEIALHHDIQVDFQSMVNPPWLTEATAEENS